MPFLDEDRLYENIEKKYKFSRGEARKAYSDVLDTICEMPSADVEVVRHTQCKVCSGKEILTQDSYTRNGYYIEINDELRELTVWVGDECLAVFPIDYCPHCGAKMDGKE